MRPSKSTTFILHQFKVASTTWKGRCVAWHAGQTLAQQGQEVLQSREEIVALEMPPLQFAAAER